MSIEEYFRETSTEALSAAVTAEMFALHDSGAGMRLEIAPATAFTVVAFVQLALRHPETGAGPSAPIVREFIEYVRAKFEPHAPAIALAIERGNEPQYDEPRPSGPAEIASKARRDALLEAQALIENGGFTALEKTVNDLLANEPEPSEEEKRRATDELMQKIHGSLEHSGFRRVTDEPRPATRNRVATPEEFADDLAKGLERAMSDTPRQAEPAEIEFFSGEQWTEEQRRQIRERRPPGPTINRLDPRQARGLMEFVLSRETPPTPEEILAFLDSRRAPAAAVLTCPHCGHSTPAPFENVDVYICAKCGRTVETQ